jgi:hypothetical protein
MQVRIRSQPDRAYRGPMPLPLTTAAAVRFAEALRRELGALATVVRSSPRDPVSPQRFVVVAGAWAMELTAREARDLLDAVTSLLDDPSEGHWHVYEDAYWDEVVVYLDEDATDEPVVRRLA